MPENDRWIREAFERRKHSVGWFNPPQLARTGWQAFLSTTIGAFADRREVQAGIARLHVNGKPAVHDFSNEQAFSFDFVADTGDGWTATRAVAELLWRREVCALPRPRIVVFGGDLVYPTASLEDYGRRFVGPFTHAALHHGERHRERDDPVSPGDPRVFATPGNHDWYDGLAAFWALFCRARLGPSGGRTGAQWVGPWVAEQQRSYFALRLPNNWWLWGIDVHLSGWIDQPQADYFGDLAAEMGRGSQLIVCAAQPSWVYGQEDAPHRFENLGFALRCALAAGVSVRAVLTGDSHHYSRYQGRLTIAGTEAAPVPCEFVTAGGGGAFTHPTHQLPATLVLGADQLPSWSARLERADRKCVYPSRATSWFYSFVNLTFPALNPGFVVLMALVCAGWQRAPWTTQAVLFAALVAFANAPSRARIRDVWLRRFPLAWRVRRSLAPWIHGTLRVAMGSLHARGHVAVWETAQHFTAECVTSPVARLALTALVGGIASGFVMGVYLLVCTNVFHRHQNEAFSALRSRRWKNFLRVTFDAQGNGTIHAIGLAKPGTEPERIETVELPRS